MDAQCLSFSFTRLPALPFVSHPKCHPPTLLKWPPNSNPNVSLVPKLIVVRTRRCNVEGNSSAEGNEGGEAYDNTRLGIDRCFFTKSGNGMPMPSDPLQLVTETIKASVIAPFLFGMVILLDMMKRTWSPYRLHQVCGLKFSTTIIDSYSFLFILSMTLSSLLGFICIPFLRRLKAYQVFRKEGPAAHFTKSGTPTMGGLFFLPVVLIIIPYAMNYQQSQISGLIAATFLFGGIGLLDDMLSLVRKHNYGLPGWWKLFFQVISGVWFYFWNESTCFPTIFRVKTMLLLPPPFNHWNLGFWYLPLTAFCFAAMSNGVNLTDGLDGLAAGSAAAAFLGMAMATSNTYPAVTIFGVSMAGACLGFLVHNHHKAAVFMGDTGSLALGGALAAMAASTGLFVPLLICSGVFCIETVSVILQISYKTCTKKFTGVTKKLFRMAPIHHHFELGGVKETTIVAVAHAISCILAIIGAYTGLVISRGLLPN